MPSIKQFNRNRSKLKGFLMQMKLKLQTKKAKFALFKDSIMYTGLFLLKKKALEWFKPYLTKYYNNRAITDHLETRFIFLE